MDWVKAHLALNHVSVIGTPFLALLLGWGWFRRREELVRLGLWWITIFSVISIALKFTGDFAAEQKGSDLAEVKRFVDRHEQSADQATAAVFLMGVAAGVALFAGRKRGRVPVWALAMTLLMAIGSGVMLARTAHLGGEITHPELRERPGE